MDKKHLINILHKNSQGLLPTSSLDELLTSYAQNIVEQYEAPVPEKKTREKLKEVAIEFKNILVWKVKKLTANIIIKLLDDDDMRIMVRQKVQTKHLRHIAETYDGIIEDMRKEYWHELDTAVKKEFVTKWLSVCRQLLVERLKN